MMDEPMPPDRGKDKNFDWNMDTSTQASGTGNASSGNENKIGNGNGGSSVSNKNSNKNQLEIGQITNHPINKGNIFSNNNLRDSDNLHSSTPIIEKDIQRLLQKTVDKEKQKSVNKEARPVLLYTNNDLGPFIVYVQNKEGNIGKFHRISTAKLIREAIPQFQNNINDISVIGVNRIKVEFSNGESANKLVESKLLSEKNYDVFIPQFNKRRQGVVKGVDIDISEEELVHIIKPKFGKELEILEIRRLKRKLIINNEVTYVPNQTIVISFKGQTLPKQVVIEKIIFEVEPYIQRVVQCLKCLRYGHISNQCKGTERCKRCGEPHSNCSQDEILFCVLCKGAHEATDRRVCPEFAKQKTVKNIMGTQNISYKEAVKKYVSSYANIVQSNNVNLNYTGKQNIVPSTPISSQQRSNHFTQIIKRKRVDNNPVSNNPLLEEHKNIITPYTPQSQPLINKYPPQYHNKYSVNLNQKNLGQKIMSSIKHTLESKNMLDYSLFNIIEESVISIIQQCSP